MDSVFGEGGWMLQMYVYGNKKENFGALSPSRIHWAPPPSKVCKELKLYNMLKSVQDELKLYNMKLFTHSYHVRVRLGYTMCSCQSHTSPFHIKGYVRLNTHAPTNYIPPPSI